MVKKKNNSPLSPLAIFLFNYLVCECTVGQKKNTPIYFNTNYHREIKVVPIIMDCLFQFEALKFFFGLRLLGGSLPNFNFFNVNPQFFQRNRKVHLSNYLEINFRNFFNISFRVIGRRNYS